MKLQKRIRQLLTYVPLTALLLCAAPAAKAETVTQKQAKEIAGKFFNAANGRFMAEPKCIYNGRQLTTQRLFVPFYVYTLPSGGFVVISAENKAFPILAYSLTDYFDPEKLSDGMKAVLRSYAFDIERIRYDSRVPEEAIAAWGDINHYIDRQLKAPYEATDVLYTPTETKEMVEYVAENDNASDMWSDIYSPDQWEDLVNDELDRRGNVALGIVYSGNVTPVTLHGRKGDFYRMSFSGPDRSLYRLLATEFINDSQVAMLNEAPGLPAVTEPDTAFKFYTDFAEETRREREARDRAFEDALIVTEPVVHAHGSGQYTVDLPEEAVMARIYNVGGAMSRQFTYKGTMSPHIDLAAEPSGFYVASILGRSGRTYSVKLAR